jgi:hypothetical protein
MARRLPAPPAPEVDTSPGNFAKPPMGESGTPINAGAASVSGSSQLAPMPPRIGHEIKAPSRSQVRAALVKARARNLAFFRAYYRAGIYPNNTYSKDTLNVWRDEAGHFCAAATIMVKSGDKDLAIRLAEENNFIKLADVRHGEVMDWITMSGFTQAELVMIQKPFRPVTTNPQMPTVATTGAVLDQPSVVTMDPPSVVVPSAPQPLIDARMRKQETARLLAIYKQVDAKLVAQQKKSLDAATNRLLKNPTLAWELVNAMR